MSDGVEGFPVITGPTQKYLDERQIVDYRSQREGFLDWLLHFGRDPEKAEGYSEYTVRDTMYRTDRFYRWAWTENEGYTLSIGHEEADEFMKHLARKDCSANNKATVQRAVKRLYKWFSHEQGTSEWEPDITYSNPAVGQPQDFLTRPERRDIREAALEYGSVPNYSDLDPESRQEWKKYLAHRFCKPMSEVKPQDWKQANGWKFPSIVWASLDAGLRPVEVKRARASWVDVNNERLLIPKDQSSKNRENWKPPLTERTTVALANWLEERKLYDLYDDSDALWLTREGNPYSAGALRYLMGRLFEVADIPADNRKVSWYMIRHSTGTYMSREEGLEAARQQLRHKSPETTMRYDQAPEGERRDALDRMG